MWWLDVRRWPLLALVLCLFSAAPARAVPLPVTLHVSDGAGTVDLALDGSVNAFGEYRSSGQFTTSEWSLTWSAIGRLPGPFGAGISASWDFTNRTGVNNTYTISFIQTVGQLGPTTRFGGRFDAQVTDLTGDSAVLSTDDAASNPMFAALIDSNIVHETLFSPTSIIAPTPYSWNAIIGGDFPGFGLDGIPGPGVTSDIGFAAHFNLSAGDQAGFHTTSFGVRPVPEPEAAHSVIVAVLTVITFCSVRRTFAVRSIRFGACRETA